MAEADWDFKRVWGRVEEGGLEGADAHWVGLGSIPEGVTFKATLNGQPRTYLHPINCPCPMRLAPLSPPLFLSLKET